MPPLRRRHHRLLLGAAIVVSVYALLAYVVLPMAWSHYEHQRRLQDLPMVTRTALGIPGDPLNIAFVGSREDIAFAMQAAGWSPADKLTWRSSLAIVGSIILDHAYRDAPVSPLFFAGRREDLAYEKEDGASADRRHHVRLWQALATGAEGRPVWLGAATFDAGVGLSQYTGQVTHHIAADIDAERDYLGAGLVEAGMVTTTYQVSGIGPTLFGRNGGGDRYFTDGEIHVLVLTKRGAVERMPPTELADPPLVAFKDGLWRRFRSAVKVD